MTLIRWLKSLLSQREKALSLYRAGIDKANARDYKGAIAHYTSAIEMSSVPTDVKAMATYNRALAYSSIHEDEKAAADLEAMLTMPGLSPRIQAEAQQRRDRIRRRHER